MGIREWGEELNKSNITFIMHEKDFKSFGYWLRSIKSKIKGKEIKNIDIQINIEYLDRGE